MGPRRLRLQSLLQESDQDRHCKQGNHKLIVNPSTSNCCGSLHLVPSNAHLGQSHTVSLMSSSPINATSLQIQVHTKM